MKKKSAIILLLLLAVCLVACGSENANDSSQNTRNEANYSPNSNGGAVNSGYSGSQSIRDISLEFSFSEQGQTHIKIVDDECFKTMITDEDPYGEQCYEYTLSLFTDDMKLLGAVILSDSSSFCSLNREGIDADAWKASEKDFQIVFEDIRVREMLQEAQRYSLMLSPRVFGDVSQVDQSNCLVSEGALNVFSNSTLSKHDFESLIKVVYGDNWNEQCFDIEQIEEAVLPYYAGTYICETDHESTEQVNHIYRCELNMPSGYAPGVDCHFFAKEYTGTLRYSNEDLTLHDDGSLSVTARYEVVGYGEYDAYLTFSGGNSIHVKFSIDGETYSETLHPER